MDGYEANAHFQRDYYKRRKLAGRSPGNDDEVSIIWFPHKLNIVLEGWKDGLRTRLEYYTPLKKGFILQSKGAHFEKIRLAAFRAAQHGLYTSNLLPTPLCNEVNMCLLKLCPVTMSLAVHHW